MENLSFGLTQLNLPTIKRLEELNQDSEGDLERRLVDICPTLTLAKLKSTLEDLETYARDLDSDIRNAEMILSSYPTAAPRGFPKEPVQLGQWLREGRDSFSINIDEASLSITDDHFLALQWYSERPTDPDPPYPELKMFNGVLSDLGRLLKGIEDLYVERPDSGQFFEILQDLRQAFENSRRLLGFEEERIPYRVYSRDRAAEGLVRFAYKKRRLEWFIAHLFKFADVLPSRSRRLDTLIKEVEIGIRDVIEVALKGDPSLLPTHLWDGIEVLQQKDAERNPGCDGHHYATLKGKLEFCFLEGLKDTILNKQLWSRFERRFKKKKMVEWRFDQLIALRNCFAHCRPVPMPTRKDGEAAILWFGPVLGRDFDIREDSS